MATGLKCCFKEEAASQIAEFALSLPLLVVFVVGIFDFSGAVTLKQRLTNAAREGARIAAADPANDLSSLASSKATSVPVSVSDALQVVDNYLLSENIGDCGLSTSTPTYTTALTWTATAAGSPCRAASALNVTINRGCIQQETVNKTTVNAVATCINIQYPYQWTYNKVITLLGPTFTGPTSLNTSATAYNEN